LTSFIGREREIEEVKTLLSPLAGRAEVRLLTLTGAGGSGKTRLALQVAADLLNDYRDGVWFVDLAPLANPDLLPHVVRTALAVSDQPGRPALDLLTQFLRPKQLLLVLDNCEHLVAACAQVAVALLAAAPGLQILATSREALAVAGEIVWNVPGLARPRLRPLPPLEQIAQLDAVRLFATRATATVPSFRLATQNVAGVAHICERLDGLPLALELAAARVKLLSVDQIATRLDDRFHLLASTGRSAPARHQTLQATLDWSYGLLASEERTLLQRLAVFAGSWTLEAAEAVCIGPPIHATVILDLLARLVDKSLVVVEHQPDGTVRYRLLETIRQYALERLSESGDAPARQEQHAGYYVALAETAEPALHGPQQLQWYARLEMELDNLRSALAWSLAEPARGELGLRLAVALWPFLGRHVNEWRRWLHELLARTPPASTPARAKALYLAGELAHYQYDWITAWSQLNESVAMCRQLGDNSLLFQALLVCAEIALNEGRIALADEHITEAQTLTAVNSSVMNMARICQIKGRAAWLQGDNDAAQSHYQAALRCYREISNLLGQASTLVELGQIVFFQGNYTSASATLEQALDLYQKLDDKPFMALTLWGLGVATKLLSHSDLAEEFFSKSHALCQEVGYEFIVTFSLSYFTRLANLRGEPAQFSRLLGIVKLNAELFEPFLSAEARNGFTRLIAMLQENEQQAF
jgi:non-specific serine/threonine protein kinase